MKHENNIRIEHLMILFLGLLIFNETVVDLNYIKWNFKIGKTHYLKLIFSIGLIAGNAFLIFRNHREK